MGVLVTTQAISPAVSFAPRLLSDGGRIEDQADWAIIGAVAGLFGLGLGVVAYICGVCQARSFNACVDAVRNYWGSGC
ncbi:hypothetical protein [Sinomonas terrae]|jgi:hypothetical protein|uniref:Uncharacterized protein n=1 Tax=Sinomonas terrae TaxID=2908838 RepID=A0ABS9U362_9MICC|nr:hypothetical protein [Sinomonas terrae]MCH6471011.1 hypothetical protein [Sinomonas terrae]